MTYSWKPFHKRNPEHQEDYLRLLKNMSETGTMINPLIVFRDCVLIGQRRCEIAQKLGWAMVPCWEITTDISDDAQPDRVFELRDQYKKVNY
ncbi:MAG: hypothetical protein E4G91_11300 [Candidatus Zixiibacteriota bacterium]|nr:MAG: hypothetical protein E4G91_11300 [candidate division Zixibacteria bacterium]